MMNKAWRIRWAIGAAAVMAVLAALFFSRPIYLPDAVLITQLESRISAATGLNLTIRSGRITLRHALVLQNVSLGDSTAGLFITADEVILRYRLLPLREKRAIFSEIQILNSRVQLITATKDAPDSSSEKPAAGKNIPHELPSQHPSNLPFDFQTADLSLVNASFYWEICTPNDTLRVLIPGINLHAREVHLNPQAALRAEWVVEQRGMIHFENIGFLKARTLAASSQMRFDITTLEDSSRIVGQLDFSPRLESTSSNGEQRSLVVPEIALDFDSRLIRWRDLRIDSLNMALENLLELQAAATAANLFKAPCWNIRLAQASIFLDSGWNFIQELAGQFGANSGFGDWKLAGRLQLQEGSLRWTPGLRPPDLAAALHFIVSEGSVESQSLDWVADNLQLESDVLISLLPQDSLHFKCQANLTAGLVAKGRGRDALLKLDSLDLSMSANAGSNWSHPRCQMNWQARGPFGTTLAGNVAAQADTLALANPASSPGLAIEGGASVDGLSLEELFSTGPRGDVSVALDIKAPTLDDFSLKLGIFGWDVWFALGDDIVLLPPSLLKLNATCSLDPELGRYYLRQGNAECHPYFAWAFDDFSTDLSRWEIRQSSLSLNLPEIHALFQPALSARFARAQIGGVLQLKGPMRGSFEDGGIALLPGCTLGTSAMTLALPDFELSADSVHVAASLEGDWKSPAVSGEIRAGKLALPRLREIPYRDLVLAFGANLREFERLDSFEVRLSSDELRLQIESRGWLDWASPWPRGDLANQIHFDAADTVFLLADLAGAGSLKAEIQCAIASDSSLGATGRISADSLFLEHRKGWRIQNGHLELPFHQEAKLALQGIEIPSLSADAVRIPDPVQFAGLDYINPPSMSRGEFRANLLQIAPYVLQDLDGTVILGQGYLHIPQIAAKSYEGALSGAGVFRISALRPDSIRYDIQCDAQRINSARLPGVRSSRGGQETEISAFARFHGRDFDLQGDHELGGTLEITRMGSRVADNILKFLDPEDSDPAIRTYRRYLQRGWGVRSFNFEVRDDFVYTSLVPAKPPISKPDMFVLSRLIGLGQSVTFGRLPVRFFLASRNTKPP